MTTIEAIVSELKESIDYRCRPELDDIDAANILACIESLTTERDALAQENKRLREALERNKRGLDAVYALQSKWHLIGIDARETSRLWDEIRNLEAIIAMGIQALALPSDATALNELIAERTKELTAEVERLKAITFPVNIDYGDGPEEVAYGNEHQVRRLKKWLDKYFQLRQQLTDANTTIQHAAQMEAMDNQQLAAAQAQIVGYRDAILQFRNEPILGQSIRIRATTGYAAMEDALDQPADTSALESIVTKAGEVMRERCATKSVDWGDARKDEHGGHACRNLAEAIRALPGVTMEDLQK